MLVREIGGVALSDDEGVLTSSDEDVEEESDRFERDGYEGWGRVDAG